ncbi:MAG TPA: efflux RND transporter permease subunit [Thauera sp.]|uniref:efflux RND transporter permease subunit n=1 Tax=Thauera sp. TaxID=1905334 RepID=UPI000FB97725|nr:efflux RND transporter permease subunit [Thauera sp.]MCB1946084.1 efflux RND transporter permease subunit [Thauera sp.]MCP5225043.1 efflux RND transporter permease subunit [Thauera sp.]RTL31530.1 MAG: efflux RND transporter permease subunit [Rhodocyclaceae bacterium]HRV78150.1 efflux RND transporter permease subunit [Thauera sp.]
MRHVSLLERLAGHKVAANVLMLLAFVLGTIGITRMNVQFFPTFELDVISVRVVWTGASAEDVEIGITAPLEERLKTVDGLKKMSSTSAQGVASITLELHEDTDALLALDQVRQRVDEFRNLPRDAETPEVSRVSRYEPIARLLVRGGSIEELRPWVRRFESELLAAGIDRITLTGLPEERIAIEIPAAALETLGLSLVQVGDRVGQLARDFPAGIAGEADGAREIRGLEQRRSADAFAPLPVVSDTLGVVRLGEIARLTREPRNNELALFERGDAVVEMQLQRSESGHSLKAARVLEGWLEKTRPTLPPSIHLEVFDEQWQLISERIELLVNNGLSGLVLVVAVLYFFLPGRVAFWVMVGVPTAFLATLALMYVLGGTLNMMSLFALIMALGIIVDDAIVVSEDADTHRHMGEGAAQAALGGARRMLWPVIASSLTTVAAFLPLMMVGGIIGNILGDIPFVMVAVITASLIECFLILPAHLRGALAGAAALEHSALRARIDGGFARFRDGPFRRLVERALAWRGATVAFTFGLMVLAVGLIAGGRIGFVFFPTPEGQVIYANATFVAGTPRAHTEAFLGELERALFAAEAELGGDLVQTAVARLGGTISSGSGSSARGDQLAGIMVELVPPDTREVRNERFLAVWREKLPTVAGLELLTFTARQSGPPGRDINIRLTGDDADALKTAALELAETLKSIPGVSEPEDDMPYGREQLVYRLTPAGEALGLTTESLGRQLRAAFDGALAQLVQVGRDELEVRVMLPREERSRLDVFERINVSLPDGRFVPLATVASWESRRGFEALRHAQGRLAVEVSAAVDSHVSNANVVQAELERDTLPQLAHKYGFEFSFEGRSADQRETMADMKAGLVLGLGLIYLVLVWSFSSWSWPLVVMSAIPLGLAGAIFGHWLLGIDLTILSMFGLFGLAGIVVNNSIILVSLFKELQHKGAALQEALVGASCGRLRAVLLTSLTTVGGLTPLLFERSLQAQFLIPMAASIAFGLGFSVVLVLFFVPALLSMLESLRAWMAGAPREAAAG